MDFSPILLPVEDIQQAADKVKAGSLVAFPTETVYGLGANALMPDAVRSIFTAKGRPLTDPIIVHISSQEQANDLILFTPRVKHIFEILLTKFWPGPITFVMKASSIIDPILTANTGYLGI